MEKQRLPGSKIKKPPPSLEAAFIRIRMIILHQFIHLTTNLVFHNLAVNLGGPDVGMAKHLRYAFDGNAMQ